MHIQFEKIKYKNILAVGDHSIEMVLNDYKTTLISGQNGSGKSTLIEAISFALFNRSFRKINKPQLINSVNKKDLIVELEFSIASDKFVVKRGMKPNIFEIWKNGELLNKDAASKDYQAYLEESILKMSYKSFTQIVILGSATYVPFMDLPAGQRREIIEDLLDIQVFSTMNTLLKDKISYNKEEISENNHAITLLKTKLESAKKYNHEIQNIKQTEVKKLKEKVSEHLKTIESDKEEIEKYESQITELGETINDKAEKKKTLEKVKSLSQDIHTKKKAHEREISFYHDHDNCPTCKQGIEQDFKIEILNEKTDKNKELETGLEKLKEKQDQVENRLEEISKTEDQIKLLHNKANEHRLSVKMTKDQLKSIKEELESAKKEVEEIDQTQINEYTEELKCLEKTQTDLYNKRETLGIVASMLKDGGIKTSIIKTYIPIMNKIINQYLSEFELFVDFNLDENFNETIKSRFRDKFSFGSFSEGERMRINLAIMFTWRALAKIRNSVSTNLLLLDEILDGPSDEVGIEAIISILNKPNTKDNIFIISHRGDNFKDSFDQHIQFKKVRNFTELEVDN